MLNMVIQEVTVWRLFTVPIPRSAYTTLIYSIHKQSLSHGRNRNYAKDIAYIWRLRSFRVRRLDPATNQRNGSVAEFLELGRTLVPSLASLEGSKKFIQTIWFFFSLYIKMWKETDVTDFFKHLPYDTNVYSMLQKLIITQLLCVILCRFIVL